jgi:PleD family two-component response regulator
MVQKLVFVVDDSEIILEAATSALEAANFQVRKLARWEELDSQLKDETPDLILMDINMPEMTGDFALMFFKEERGISHVPILLFSDIEEDELEERAKNCGANGFISKGWGTDRMVSVVREYLS